MESRLPRRIWFGGKNPERNSLEDSLRRIQLDRELGYRLREISETALSGDYYDAPVRFELPVLRAATKLVQMGRPVAMGQSHTSVPYRDGTTTPGAEVLWSTHIKPYSEFGVYELVARHRAWLRRAWDAARRTDGRRRQRAILTIRIGLPDAKYPRLAGMEALQELLREFVPARRWALRGTHRQATIAAGGKSECCRLAMLVWSDDDRDPMELLRQLAPEIEAWLRAWLDDDVPVTVTVPEQVSRTRWMQLGHIVYSRREDGTISDLGDADLLDYIIAWRGDGRQGQPRYYCARGTYAPTTWHRRPAARKSRLYERRHAYRDLYSEEGRRFLARQMGPLLQTLIECTSDQGKNPDNVPKWMHQMWACGKLAWMLRSGATRQPLPPLPTDGIDDALAERYIEESVRRGTPDGEWKHPSRPSTRLGDLISFLGRCFSMMCSGASVGKTPAECHERAVQRRRAKLRIRRKPATAAMATATTSK